MNKMTKERQKGKDGGPILYPNARAKATRGNEETVRLQRLFLNGKCTAIGKEQSTSRQTSNSLGYSSLQMVPDAHRSSQVRRIPRKCMRTFFELQGHRAWLLDCYSICPAAGRSE